MHFWLVRVLLNIVALAAGGVIGVAGVMATGSPISFAFSVLIYFFLAWGLAVQATQGPARVGFRAYVRPLLLTYWVLGAIAVFVMLVGQAATEANPEAPDFAAGLQSVLSLQSLVMVVGGGFVVSIVLLIPPVIAIVDRPPPEDRSVQPDTGAAADLADQVAMSNRQFVQPVTSHPEQRQADIAPDPTGEHTLEELFGLEPRHHA